MSATSNVWHARDRTGALSALLNVSVIEPAAIILHMSVMLLHDNICDSKYAKWSLR